MTSEAKVKQKIKLVLDGEGDRLYYHMPVPVGFGRSTVDFLGCHKGRFFAIEAKQPKSRPSTRQEGIISDIEAAGGTVFRINDDVGLTALREWLVW